MVDVTGCHSEPKRMRMPFALLKVKNLVAHGQELFSSENEILRRFVL
jgi:hypothetical protein